MSIDIQQALEKRGKFCLFIKIVRVKHLIIINEAKYKHVM